MLTVTPANDINLWKEQAFLDRVRPIEERLLAIVTAHWSRMKRDGHLACQFPTPREGDEELHHALVRSDLLCFVTTLPVEFSSMINARIWAGIVQGVSWKFKVTLPWSTILFIELCED